MEQMWKAQSLCCILLFLLSGTLQQSIYQSELYSLLENRTYEGSWKILNQNDSFLSSLGAESGEIKVKFLQHSVVFETNNELHQKFQSQLPLNHFIISNMSGKSCNITEIIKNNFSVDQQCIPEFIVQVSNISNKINNTKIAIFLNNNTLKSQCNFLINLSTSSNNSQQDYYNQELIIFESLAFLYWIFQLLIPLFFLKYVMHKKVQFYQMSIIAQFFKYREMLFILQFLLFNLQQSNIYALLILMYAFLIVFWSIILIIMLELKLNFYMFFRKQPSINKFTKLFILISAFILNVVMYNYCSSFFLYQLSYSLILYPQIIHNVRLNRKENFNFVYLFGYLSPGLLFQIYLKCCPSNIYDIQPDYLFFALYQSIYFTSVILLYLQHKFGSRCIIPNWLLKKNDEICVICLDVMEENNWLNQVQLLPIIKTTCNHKFHQTCLSSWLLVKQLCPLCRTPLNELNL